MGDHGKLYRIYTTQMQEKMRHLVEVADVITPNLTETYFLLNRPYEEKVLEEKEMVELAKALSQLGPKKVVIKGLFFEKDKKVNLAYDKYQDEYFILPYTEVPMHYPGTGDAFASVLVGELIKGSHLKEAVDKAASFVKKVVEVTFLAGTDPKEGILLERVMGELIR